MSDIFLSYASEDLERVQVLADALGNAGWSVWWDRRIPIGQSFDSVIQGELDAARAVVVVWTHDAVVSRWVRSEAERAAKQGKALPVVMDDVQLPLGVSLLQTADLTDWRGETDHADFQRLVDQLTEQMSDLPRKPKTGRRKGRWIQRVTTTKLAVGLLLFVLVALGSLSLLRVSEARIEIEIVTKDLNFVSATQQDLFGLLVTPRLHMAGVRRLQIPRSRTTPTQVINAEATQGIFVTLTDLDGPAGVAAMTLESLPLNDGTAVRLFVEADEPDVNLSLDGGPFRFQVNLQGQVELFLSKEVHERLDFGSPKPMQIDTVGNGVAVHLDPGTIEQRLNPEPLSVSTLGLYRIEERLVGQQTRVRKISTIISGRLAIAEAFGLDRQLPQGTTVALDIVKGGIEEIRLLDNRLQLRFRGSVAKLELCEEERCDNLMPSYLERLIRLMW